LFFARSAEKLDSLDFSLPCRAANDFPILACAANDFTVSHETNSLAGNKMYVARLKKFSLQKVLICTGTPCRYPSTGIFRPGALFSHSAMSDRL
jgi:hypothetical protein